MSLSINPLRHPGQDEWATRTLAGVEDLAVLLLGAPLLLAPLAAWVQRSGLGPSGKGQPPAAMVGRAGLACILELAGQ